MSQAGSVAGSGGGGTVVGPGSSVVGDIATWADTTGTLLADSGVAFPIPVASGGTGATTLTGVLIGNGTSAVTGNPVTNHDVIVGGASNALTSIAPSSTLGVALVSQGSGVDPAFGTTVVPGGGTGVTTLGNHGIVIGQGISPVVTISPSATAGVAVVSQGASLDPTYGTVVVAGGGTGATTLTGVIIGNGTSAFTGNAVTQHDVIVGGASNALTSVAPSSTSGVPLISQGAASDPAFGTAVVAGGGTGAVTLTNHGVLLGQGTSAVVATATGSSGQVLQSGGASADPAYSTATYPATATGTGTILRADGTNWVATTATYPNTVTQANFLYGSATNVVSGLAPTSLAGGFPTYDGTNGVWFSPRSQLYEWDDFLSSEANTSYSKICWQRMAVNGGGISMTNAAQESGHPGVASLNITTSAGSGGGLICGVNGGNNPLIFGGGRCIAEFIVKIPNVSDATDTFTTLIGFNSATSGALGNNALVFSQNSGVASGVWQMIAVKSGGGTTTATSGTSPDNAWHRYTIDVAADGSQASFYIDGVQLTNSPVVTANIPVAANQPVGPAVSLLRTAGTSNARAVYFDLFTIWISLTTPR